MSTSMGRVPTRRSRRRVALSFERVQSRRIIGGRVASDALVDISSKLALALDSLTEVCADPAIDLGVLLQQLVSAAEESVASLVSVTLTVWVDDYPFTVAATTRNDRESVQASVWIPLPAESRSAVGSDLLLLAGAPGAFVDMAADVVFVLRLDPDVVKLDLHLWADDSEIYSETIDLDDRRTVDQALGVLVAQGAVLQDADLDLQLRADRHGNTLADAARVVLADAFR